MPLVLTLATYLIAAVFLTFSVMLATGIWRAISKGEFVFPSGRPMYRRESPVSFWMVMSTYIVLAIVLLLCGLEVCGHGPHWFSELISHWPLARS